MGAPGGTVPWSDEEIALVRELAAASTTPLAISSLLYERLKSTRSRNAVIGVCGRLNIRLLTPSEGQRARWAQTPRPAREKEPGRPPGRPRLYPRPPIIERRRAPDHAVMNPTPFLEARGGVNGQCRYPLWGDAPIPIEQKMVCGAVGYPWCEYHAKIVRG